MSWDTLLHCCTIKRDDLQILASGLSAGKRSGREIYRQRRVLVRVNHLDDSLAAAQVLYISYFVYRLQLLHPAALPNRTWLTCGFLEFGFLAVA